MRPDFTAPPHPPSDAALRDADIVQLLVEGAVYPAFERLVQRYERKVFHLCVGLLGDAALAEEVAQESFLRVWRALPGYDAQRAALSTWLYAITRNRCLTELARHPLDSCALDAPAQQAAVQAQASPTPVNDDAALRLLHQLVNDLPAMYRTCLKLYYFEEQSTTEVAQMLGLPQGTVKTHLHRARHALHQSLQSRGLASAVLWL